jgi:RHS repeat-associated protein
VQVVDTLIYLHTDHLGSVSVATDAGGQVLSQQEYDPWGKVRSGGIGQTTLNYTGQRVDSTGLLYYHARYYDPTLARFVSPDTVVQGSTPLMVSFHEMSTSSEEEGQAGPINAQSLNRYTYVLDNPLRYGDPSGHRPAEPQTGPPDYSRYHRMVAYVYNRMMTDKSSAVGQTIAAWNKSGREAIEAAGKPGSFGYDYQTAKAGYMMLADAAILWGSMVVGGGPWDMKVPLQQEFGADNDPWIPIPVTNPDTEYFYDFFGNMYYGYVGMALGFDADELIEAGMGSLGGVSDPFDRAAIEMGILMWKRYGANLTLEQFEAAILELAICGGIRPRPGGAGNRQ